MGDTKALKLLLIENNFTDANKIIQILQEHCQYIKIEHVKGIKTAINSLTNHDFDLVLLNLSLPDSEKLDSLEQVQQKAPQLPVIILTESYNANLAVSSLRQGAQDYLVKKELRGEILARSIQYAIERQRIEFNERQQALMNKMLDKIRQSIDLKTILKNTVYEIQQFLDTEQVLIYRCESKRPENIFIVSSSLDDRSAKLAVMQFMSAVDLSALHSADSQSIYVKAVEDTKANNLSADSTLKIDLARSYLSLPINLNQSPDLGYKNLTHPIIEQDNASESAEELWGMLIAYNTEAPRQWQTWEINFLQKLTTQVTIAIQQSQLCSRLHNANQQLQQLAILDGLTGIANRRYFDLVLNNEWKRLTREQKPLSLILCDIDYFKSYNDSYGHQKGDLCLQTVAQVLQRNTRRSTDLVGRYGGEEFAIILPNTDSHGALFIAQNIQQKLAELKLPHQGSKISDYVTCSMGIATIIPSVNRSVINIIESADKLLYKAKNSGRNQIAVDYQKSYQTLNLNV